MYIAYAVWYAIQGLGCYRVSGPELPAEMGIINDRVISFMERHRRHGGECRVFIVATRSSGTLLSQEA